MISKYFHIDFLSTFLFPGPDLSTSHCSFKRIYKEKEALYVCLILYNQPTDSTQYIAKEGK